jgi:cytidyltransferase-like protein
MLEPKRTIDVLDGVHFRDKIVAFDDLPRIRERFRDRRIVHCHGAFDLVHIGHLIHFDEARALGDILVVTITADAHITKKRSVTFSEVYRARQVAALEIVDFVAIVQEPTALSAIDALRPDVYVKGPEYADLTLDKSRSIYHERQLLERYGARMHFTAGDTFSSTKLSHFLLSSPEASQVNPLLRNERILFKDVSALGFKLDQLKQFVARAAMLRVCVIGETIVDEWVDVTLTNLSTQSRCVAGLEADRVRQPGGVGIIAQHLSHFVEHVDTCSNASGELVETRFVDQESGRPVFKCKAMRLRDGDCPPLPRFDDYDLVIVADFGHGLLDQAAVNERIAASDRAVVAAMAQANSSNFGYNLPLKYVGADYYSLNRAEAELCLHERQLPLAQLLDRSRALLGADTVSVTDGADGAMVFDRGVTYAMPSLSVSAVDTIGCGDAYLALSSLAVCLGMPAPMIALTGSIGAAAMAQRRCNAAPVTEQEFLTIGKIVI